MRLGRTGSAAAGMSPSARSGFEGIFRGRPVLCHDADAPWLPFPDALRGHLLAAAAADPGREVCGFVGGRQGLLHTAYPVPNCAREPERRFEMAPQALVQAWRRIAARDQELLAVYHSHLSGPACPSPTDLAEHVYRELLCIIVSPSAVTGAPLRAFLIGERATEVGLRGDAPL